MRKLLTFFGCGLFAAGLAFGPARSQDAAPPTPTPPGAVAPAPAAPQAPPAAEALKPAPSAPSGSAAPAPPAATGESAAPGGPSLPTLVPSSGDPVDVDEVVLPAEPAAVLSGTSTWDDGFDNLKKAFLRIREELAKAGLKPAGRPIAVFVETDDLSFRYDAMIPVERAPEGRTNLSPDVRFGQTPSGKALRFVHKGPYDDIDSTYETITAYLDAKDIAVKDSFIEEYLTDLTDAADPNLAINIFALPK